LSSGVVLSKSLEGVAAYVRFETTVMHETQGDFYFSLVLFTFAGQLYFYFLGPIIKIGYLYFNFWKQTMPIRIRI